MKECTTLLTIIGELAADSKLTDEDEIQSVVKLIVEAKRVFIAGAGRSGFAARAFSNRLMHLGLTVYFVGEPTTPSIQEADLLIIGSGSGETASLVTMAKKASSQGAKIATLTIFPDHTIGSMADAIIKIPGVTAKCGSETGKQSSIQPLGSSFEQLSWLIYDSIIIEVNKVVKQSYEQMYARHANLE